MDSFIILFNIFKLINYFFSIIIAYYSYNIYKERLSFRIIVQDQEDRHKYDSCKVYNLESKHMYYNPKTHNPKTHNIKENYLYDNSGVYNLKSSISI